MSTDVYAGQLCATHLNEQIAHSDLDPELRWWLVEIRYSQRYDTVVAIARGVNLDGPLNSRDDALPKVMKIMRLSTDDYVTISRR